MQQALWQAKPRKRQKSAAPARIGEILLSWYCATKDNQLTIYGKRTTGIRPILVHSNLDIE
jgi:hypothetical protein